MAVAPPELNRESRGTVPPNRVPGCRSASNPLKVNTEPCRISGGSVPGVGE